MRAVIYNIATRERINFILRTEIFRDLKRRGFRQVIVSPFGDDEKFREEFGGENVVFEKMCSLTSVAEHLANLRNEALVIKNQRLAYAKFVHERATIRYRQPENKRSLCVYLKKMFIQLIRILTGSPRLWDFIERLFSQNRCVDKILREYPDSCLILASAGVEGSDIPWIIAANRRGIPIFATDNNIDVFEFRYFSRPRRITRWMLWSEVQKNDAVSMQKIPTSAIKVTGPARYDFYFGGFKRLSREEFCAQVGLDPRKKIITYGSKVQKMFPGNGDIIKILTEFVATRQDQPSQLFIRFAPGDDPKLYAKDLGGVVYEEAYQAMDREHIANLLLHSDVVLSVGSTFCLESVMLDRPSLWISFDGYAEIPWEDSYKKFYDLELFKRILKTRGVRLANSPSELSDLIVAYLKDPAKDRKEREALVRQEYMDRDGRASQKIVAEIISTCGWK